MNKFPEEEAIRPTIFSQKGPGNYTSASVSDLAGKRVLLLFPHMVMRGGALNYMLRLSEQLVKRKATVGILTLQEDKQLHGSLAGTEILNLNGPVTSSIRYWSLFPLWQKKIEGKILNWQPDVLVPQVFPANWWAWMYKKKHGVIPVVWVCPEPSAFIHSRDWIDALRPFWKKYLALLLNPALAYVDTRLSLYADKIVANSQFTAGMIEKTYKRRPDAVAYPGIDSSEFQAGNPDQKQDSIITVAKLSRFKRVDFLLRVFSQLLKQHPNLKYHIVGQGEEEENLQRLAAELKVAENVIFHSSLDNSHLADLLKGAILFLHGSVAEPFGMAPLEALACGTPVIAHRSGGPQEFINDSCGRLIDSLAEEQWEKEINEFLAMLQADPGYFRDVAEHARKFTWSTTLVPALQLIANTVSDR